MKGIGTRTEQNGTERNAIEMERNTMDFESISPTLDDDGDDDDEQQQQQHPFRTQTFI